ncbi:hypothetical protein BJ508DRAFT_103536 [Ascobolus immersus RN42]|uniref:Nephrocystin 3-like N-terminal domain-containing protein n=1 Tax=Ascobolus immersus RN42 TaxID=1160509 RepID=A0A3N4H948_ASCIM|nr:hypothetical protein BJ508DRAFT_103536 [Ascobolus immersus RN42]
MLNGHRSRILLSLLTWCVQKVSVKIKNIDEMVQDVHKRVESMGMAYDMMTVFVDSFEEFKQETRTEKLEADRRKWRRWLHWVDPKPELRRKLKLRMEGTCEWVYKDPKFEDWYQSSENQTLWIKAKAGTGKSVVVATILDHLEQRNRLLPPSQNPVLLYYFFRQGGKRTDNVRTMLTTLMGQLFDIAVYGDQEFAPAYTEKLFEILKPQYHRHTDKADKGSIEPEELLELLKRMLEQVPTQVMIVLDALDECSAEGRQLIMQNLVSADKFPARFLVTGRPELDINEHLERAAGVVKMLEMDNQKDIDMFVERKIDNEPRLHPHREAIITKISQTTDGMFQYAATMMEMLSGPSGDQTIEELLDIMPSELFKLYGMYVQRLPQDPSLTKLRQTTLMFIAIAKRPVTAKEIAYAHAVKRSGEENFDPTKKFLAREEEVMRASGTLIECQASLLRFSHLTVREFLFSDMDFLLQMGGLDSLCFQNSRLSAELNLHATMALVTVSQLSEVALRLSKSEHVVCELWERDSEFAVPPDGMSAVTYAANYYHAHAAKVAPFDPDGSLFRNLWDKIERLEASELGILWYELLIESPEYVYEYGGPPMALQRNREWRAKFRQQETKQLHYMTSFGFRYLLRRRLQDPGVRDVINLQGMTGDTALHSAISKIQDRELAPEPSSDDLEIVSMLLGVDGIDTNIGNNKGVTPLMLAVGKPISVVELLLQQDGVDVNARSRVGDECTLLHDIIEWDDRDFLLRLLERKELDLNLPVTKHGTSALAQAVVLDRFEIIQLLLARNELNVNATSKSSGETALHIACAGGAQSIRAVEMLLLRHDLLLNITNSEGQTALFAAVEGGSAEVVRTLLDHAADSFDLNQTDGSGNTVLMLAVRLGFTEIVRALSERAGLDFGRRNANGETALLTAASLGYEEITSILLAKSDGFVANMPSEEGFTPLTAAIANAYSDVVPVLLERLDIDVNRRVSCTVLNKRSGIRVSMRGVTPIMIAGFRGLLKSAQALASRKDMYINLEDYNGRTALDYAIKNNYMVTASFLRSKGAFHSIDVLSKISSAPAQLDRAFAKDLRRSRQVVRTESHWCASATIVKYRVLRALPSWCDGGRFAECLGLGIGVRRLELAVVYWAGARQCTGRTDQ